ncbi:MAG: hypothetical protein NVS9B12_02540 [Vulcanimicrobiaceae bacterium]
MEIRRFAAATASGIAALACIGSVRAATVTGNLEHPSVVWISQPSQPKGREIEMRNRDRQFSPSLLVIHTGDSVRFPNDDPFYHSIYSYANNDPFDIGYYGNGPGKIVSFAVPGAIDVRCHIHPGMHAAIIVADGPSTKSAVKSFSISGVAEGKHVLHIWSEGSEPRAVDILLTAQQQTLDLGKL